jgi:hypothetical protein
MDYFPGSETPPNPPIFDEGLRRSMDFWEPPIWVVED